MTAKSTAAAIVAGETTFAAAALDILNGASPAAEVEVQPNLPVDLMEKLAEAAAVTKPAATKKPAAKKPAAAKVAKPVKEPKPAREVVAFDEINAFLAGLRMGKSDLARAVGVGPSLISDWTGSGRKSGLNAARWPEVQEKARDYAAKRDAVAAKLAQEAGAAAVKEATATAKAEAKAAAKAATVAA